MGANGWQRTTTRTTLSAAPEHLRRAVRGRADADGLLLTDDVPAFVTDSAQEGGGLFRRKGKQTTTLLVLGPRDVLIAIDAHDDRAPSVLAARWETLRVTDLGARLPSGAASGKLAAQLQQVADDGIDLTGFAVTAEGGPGTYHVGLGQPDAESARADVRAAIEQARAR